MQGRQDPRARRAQQVTTSGPTGIGGAAAGVAAAAMALAVVAKGTGAGGMGHRPISPGSLVDRLHFSLAWPEAAGIFAVDIVPILLAAIAALAFICVLVRVPSVTPRAFSFVIAI